MALESYSASAPGSLMLLGEHAVLHYHEAIVCAVDKRIAVKLSTCNDLAICVLSEELGVFTTNIEQLEIKSPYEYVLATLLHFKPQLKQGCTLEITSEFSSKIGFGSSAAVVVATIAVLAKWLGLEFTNEDFFKHAKEIILTVQKVGSGADLAASLYGGVIHYTSIPFMVNILPNIPKITAIYSGTKRPTVEVINIVQQAYNAEPKVYNYIFQGIHECVKQAVNAVRDSNWRRLGTIFSVQQGFMRALGVSNLVLDHLVYKLQELGALGSKISGSGLGDCVIGLGDIVFDQDIGQIPITIADQGLRYE